MTALVDIREACVPRPEVLQGGLSDKLFAAQLDQVVAGAPGYESYADADSFFDLTYPTKGLKGLLNSTFAHINANARHFAPTPPPPRHISVCKSGFDDHSVAAEHAVYRYETSFGGGKTHGLIALWHLARGAKPENLTDFVDPALLPKQCAVAALVGDTLDPVNGLTTAGNTTYTFWGEIARQLGPSAWHRLAASDAARTGPGKQVWLDIFGDTPTIIIIDELAVHLEQLKTSGNATIRKQADASIQALKVLVEAVTAAPAVRLILTLPTGTAAFAESTKSLANALNEVERQKLTTEVLDVVGRSKGASGRPADDHEIGYILQRRLFRRVDPTAADSAFSTYKELYAELTDNDVAAGPATVDPASYCDRIRTSYPFHPALIDMLDKGIGPMPGFQRARGALKMLAETVAHLWNAERTRSVPIINLGDLPLEAADVRTCITTAVDRETMEGPALADFATPGSHAAGVDSKRFPVERLATRGCTAVFCHSIGGTTTLGATEPDVFVGTLRPGEKPETVSEALSQTALRAWHLEFDGNRWFLRVKPNANKIIADEARNVSNADVTEELDRKIHDLFPSAQSTGVVRFPAGPVDVLDRPQLQLVVMSGADVTVTAHDASKPPQSIRDIAERAGASESPRTYRNGVVFLAAEHGQLSAVRETAQFELAAKRLASTTELQANLDKSVVAQIKKYSREANLKTRVAIASAYRHLYQPSGSRYNSFLTHLDVPPSDQGRVKGSQTQAIVELLEKYGKISDKVPATDLLAQKSGFSKSGEITTKELASTFWRDPEQPILLDPALINEAIQNGVRNGTWVYYDAKSELAYTKAAAPPRARSASDAWLYNYKRAEELGILRPPVTGGQIRQVLSDTRHAGQVSGLTLRSALTDSLGGVPSKEDVTQALAKASQQQDGIDSSELGIVVFRTFDDSRMPLQPTEIRAARLDDLTILRSSKIKGDPPSERIVRAQGSVGTALQSISDAIRDTDLRQVTELTVKASVEFGQTTSDLQILAVCVPQLPDFECEIAAKLDVSFRGLKGGMHFKVSGSSSHYHQIEQKVLAAVNAGSDINGSLTVIFRPRHRLRFGDNGWQNFATILKENNPGKVQIVAHVTKEVEG